MVPRALLGARTLIVSGYFVTFVAATTFGVWTLTNDFHFLATGTKFEEILFPLASLTTFVAWWFLTKISASTNGQEKLFRKAFLALSLASLVACAAYVADLVQFQEIFHSNWPQNSEFLYAIGNFLTACGFYLVARRYAAKDVATPSTEHAP